MLARWSPEEIIVSVVCRVLLAGSGSFLSRSRFSRGSLPNAGSAGSLPDAMMQDQQLQQRQQEGPRNHPGAASPNARKTLECVDGSRERRYGFPRGRRHCCLLHPALASGAAVRVGVAPAAPIVGEVAEPEPADGEIAERRRSRRQLWAPHGAWLTAALAHRPGGGQRRRGGSHGAAAAESATLVPQRQRPHARSGRDEVFNSVSGSSDHPAFPCRDWARG